MGYEHSSYHLGVRGSQVQILSSRRKAALRISGGGDWVEAAGDEEHSESVVVVVAEAAGDAAGEFDEPVDGLGAAVAGPACVPVRQERVGPLAEGAAEAGDLGDRAARERGEDLLGDLAAGGQVGMPVRVAQLLRALPGDLDLDVLLTMRERVVKARLLPVGEVLPPGAEDVADAVERVALAAAVAQGVALDAAADVINGLGAEFDSVERVQDGDGVFELVGDRVAVSGERVQRRDLDPAAEGVIALGKPVRVRLRGPARDQVEQAARTRPDASRLRSTIPVSSFGPRPPSSTGLVETWCQMCSSTPRVVT